jgi:ribosomal protein S19E (S16A)
MSTVIAQQASLWCYIIVWLTLTKSYNKIERGIAITKTNYGRVEGATSPYDFYNLPGNVQNQKLQQLQQLNQLTNSTQQTIYYTNSLANLYRNQYDKNNFRW